MSRYPSRELFNRLRRAERYVSEMGADDLLFELKPSSQFDCLALVGEKDIKLFNTEEEAGQFLDSLKSDVKNVILIHDPWRNIDNEPAYTSLEIIDMRNKQKTKEGK